MSSMQATIDQLRTIFTESFHVAPPSSEVDLLESGILDSLQFVELLAQLEQRFDLRINIDDLVLDDLRSLESIARVLNSRNGSIMAAGSSRTA